MTDFEQYGLSQGPISISGRHLLLTVDFEAFLPDRVQLWLKAMQHWANLSQKLAFKFSFFIAIEHIVKLRAHDTSLYNEFLEGITTLSKAGVLFYPHNHYVYDPQDGELLLPTPEKPQGYTKRVSAFYDAVYNHTLDFSSWMKTVREEYDRFLKEAGITQPRIIAYRAGGWDYGSSADDMKHYVDGLLTAGFHVDSSACGGIYGTPSWRVGSAFGSNAFSLSAQLVEVAPCLSLDCGTGISSRNFMATFQELIKQPALLNPMGSGVLVIVLHYDHLFHIRDAGECRYFDITDTGKVAERINRFFKRLTVLRSILRLESVTFDDLRPQLFSQ